MHTTINTYIHHYSQSHNHLKEFTCTHERTANNSDAYLEYTKQNIIKHIYENNLITMILFQVKNSTVCSVDLTINIHYSNKSTQSAQISDKAPHYPHIALICDLESQLGDPDHPKTSIYCSLHHCRDILKNSSKSAHNLLSYGRISD